MGEPAWAAPRTTVPVALLLLGGVVAVLGGHGLPWAIAAALCALLPSALRRPGLLVFVVASGLYFPLLGRFGLWDPWETHYGEVSRGILSRDDWISLWWAQDRWFWSKPILIFWTEALTWSASGLGFLPDSHPLHTEWVLRLPTYFFSMLGLLTAYVAMARIFGKRAALLGALVLATSPYYAMMTHQAITDMPCIGDDAAGDDAAARGARGPGSRGAELPDRLMCSGARGRARHVLDDLRAADLVPRQSQRDVRRRHVRLAPR